MQDLQPRSGTGIRAAIVRYGNPRTLLEYPAKVRAWRAAGSHKHLVSLPEAIYGAEAVAQNRRSRAARALYEESKRAWRSIFHDFKRKFLDARLIACGSFDSSLNPEKLIPASAWKYLKLHDLKRSTLREGKNEKRRLIYSVRIYPILEAPCAPDVLIDRSMVAVIKQHVLNDPEVASLIDRMGDEGKLAEQFLRRVPLEALGGNDFQPFEKRSAHPKIRRRQIRCAAVLKRRLYFFCDLLAEGRLIVLGVSPHTSAPSMLSPEFWKRPPAYVDLASGDISYSSDNGNEQVLILKEPTLGRPGADTRIPWMAIPATSTKAPRRYDPTAAAGSQCQKWLRLAGHRD